MAGPKRVLQAQLLQRNTHDNTIGCKLRRGAARAAAAEAAIPVNLENVQEIEAGPLEVVALRLEPASPHRQSDPGDNRLSVNDEW